MKPNTLYDEGRRTELRKPDLQPGKKYRWADRDLKKATAPGDLEDFQNAYHYIDDYCLEYKEMGFGELRNEIHLLASDLQGDADSKKIEEILNVLKAGGRTCPVFIPKYGSKLMIVIGRHRAVAFMRLSHTLIPVLHFEPLATSPLRALFVPGEALE